MADAINLPIVTETLKAIDLLITKIDVLDKKMQEATQHFIDNGKKMAGAITPTAVNENTAAIDALTRKIREQDAAIQKLTGDIDKLRTAKKNNSQQTAEEAVNQGILNRQALEAAKINSTLAGAYFKLNAEHAKAARYLQDLIARGKLATQTQRAYNKEIETAQKDFDKLNQRILAADKAVGRFNRNVGNYPMQAVKGLKDLLSAFGIAGGLQLFAQISKDIFNTTKEIQSMDMALKQVTQTQELYATSQMFLSRIAEAYGADLGKLTQQFTQFYVSAKDKISGNQIENIFESITKAAATMGLSTQQQERAFMALNQMMSKGKIQAEELRGQLGEALPGALGIMAKAVGVSEKRLGEMMKAGQLLAADVLPKFAEQLEKTYGIENVNRVETLAAAQARYTNAWRDFVRGLDEDGNKLSNFMKKAIGVGTDLLVGISRLAESDQATRNRILKTLQESGFNQTLTYYKSLEELKKEDLENDKAYTLEKVKEETAEFNRLKGRNLILKALIRDTPLGSVETAENKAERIANEKAMQNINNVLSKRKGTVQALNKLLDEGNKTTATSTELTKEQLKAIEDALKAKYEMAKKEIELQILIQETILNGETNTYKEQYAALEKYSDLKTQLIKLAYDEQIRLAKGSADKIKSADLDMQMAIIKQSSDTFSKIKSIRKKENDDYIKEINDVEDFLKKYHEDQDNREQSSQDLREKVDKAEKDLIDKKIERLKELKQATNDYLKSFGDEFASNSGFGETFNIFFKQIKDADGKMTTMFKQLLEGADTTAKKAGVIFNSLAQSAQEAFNFISEASNKNFEGEKSRLDAQYNIALKYAGDNKAAQEKLAEDLEKKKKDIDYREAKAKQKQALFNIAIDTAQAVISAVAESPLTFGLPWSAFALALGATQAALVASQEIPRYWMGGTHEGGLMMVNDGGGTNYKETVVTPDGKVIKPQGKNVVMNAPAGTEIYTHDMWQNKLADMLQGKGIDMAPVINNNPGLSKSDMHDVLMDTLGSRPEYHNNFDADGVVSYIVKGGNKTILNRNRSNGKGQRFN